MSLLQRGHVTGMCWLGRSGGTVLHFQGEKEAMLDGRPFMTAGCFVWPNQICEPFYLKIVGIIHSRRLCPSCQPLPQEATLLNTQHSEWRVLGRRGAYFWTVEGNWECRYFHNLPRSISTLMDWGVTTLAVRDFTKHGVGTHFLEVLCLKDNRTNTVGPACMLEHVYSKHVKMKSMG